jgi:hypothetical protein
VPYQYLLHLLIVTKVMGGVVGAIVVIKNGVAMMTMIVVVMVIVIVVAMVMVGIMVTITNHLGINNPMAMRNPFTFPLQCIICHSNRLASI